MLTEIAIIAAAIIFGAAAVFFIIRWQIRASASRCSSCPHGNSPLHCAPPPDADDLPADCDKLE
jgi:hypothetical protein